MGTAHRGSLVRHKKTTDHIPWGMRWQLTVTFHRYAPRLIRATQKRPLTAPPTSGHRREAVNGYLVAGRKKRGSSRSLAPNPHFGGFDQRPCTATSPPAPRVLGGLFVTSLSSCVLSLLQVREGGYTVVHREQGLFPSSSGRWERGLRSVAFVLYKKKNTRCIILHP